MLLVPSISSKYVRKVFGEIFLDILEAGYIFNHTMMWIESQSTLQNWWRILTNYFINTDSITSISKDNVFLLNSWRIWWKMIKNIWSRHYHSKLPSGLWLIASDNLITWYYYELQTKYVYNWHTSNGGRA